MTDGSFEQQRQQYHECGYLAIDDFKKSTQINRHFTGGALMYRFETSFTWLNAYYEYDRTIIIEITIHKNISILVILFLFFDSHNQQARDYLMT